MIRLTNALPEDFCGDTAESTKILCLYSCYKDSCDTYFWVSESGKTVISLQNGAMIISSNGEDTEELKEFTDLINPASIYSDYETLIKIGRKPEERINIMSRFCNISGDTAGDTLKSDEIYSLLDVSGLSLPNYPDFAVDFCRRLNKGFADYFAIKDKCAVITFNCHSSAVINGIASHEKGYGRIALESIIKKNFGRTLFVCCRDKVKGFYEKYGFSPLYFGGYWVKNR